MIETIMLIVVIFVLSGVFWYSFFYQKEKKLFNRLQRMLDCAIDGELERTEVSEEKYSALENSMKQYIDSSFLAKKNQQEQKEVIQKLISDIAHQTLTPISNLKVYGEILSEVSNENQEEIATILEQTEKLDFLIQSLVKLSRMESGIIAVHPEDTAIAQMFASVQQQFNVKAMEGVQGGGLYWNRRSGTCLNGDSGTCDFTTTGLKNDATRNAIYNAKWQVSAISGTLFYSNEAYENEMGLGTEVEDYIGLISTSDYGFAADFRTCSSQIFDYDICSEVNWLLNGEDQWTIIPMDNENTYSVYNSGMLSTLNVSNVAAIRPTLYLNFNVIKKDGTGTSSDPYQLRVS